MDARAACYMIETRERHNGGEAVSDRPMDVERKTESI